MSTAFPDRYRARVVIDKDMGSLHAWVASLSPRVRSRELLAIMRLGFAVHGGQFSIGSVQQVASVDTPADPKAISGPKEKEAKPTQVSQSDQVLEMFGGDMSFFTPAPPSPSSL